MKIDAIQIAVLDIVRHGDKQLNLRVLQSDRTLIGQASEIMAMSRAEFSRTVLVNAARAVVAHMVKQRIDETEEADGKSKG